MNRVHHAIFGDSGGRHTLLAASVERDATVEAIRARSDLAPDRPAHVEWTPYITGLRVEDVYVVMRTAPDKGASRSGMVLTHAAFAPLAEVVELDDIGRLVAALPDAPARRQVLPFSSLPEAPTGEPLPPPVHANLIDAIIGVSPAGRVGWIGDDGFDEAVRAVWRIMTADARADFSFGFAFNPRSIPTSPPRGISLIRTPRRLRDRWSGESIVDPENPSPPSSVAAALLGHPGGAEVSALLDALGRPTLPLGQYGILDKAASYYVLTQQATAPLAAVRTFAHLVGQLAPDPVRGTGLKASLITRLGSDTSTGEDLLGLRNLDPAPYADGHRVFSLAARTWARAAFTNPNGRADDAAVVSASIAAERGSIWGKSVVDAVKAELGSWRRAYAGVLWTWWQDTEATIAPTLEWMRPRSRAEQDLVADAPNDIPNSVSISVEREAAERGLLMLFAHVIAVRKPDRVFPSLAKLDPRGKRREAWEHAASLIGPKMTATAAAEIGSPHDVLLQVAGQVAAENPEVFHRLDASHTGWRRVWASAVENGMGIFDGIKSPMYQRDALLNIEVADEAAHTLLIAIANTDAADLLDHPDRPQVWARVPENVRDAYLRATAASWTKRLRSGESIDWALEPPLAQVVFDPQWNASLFDPRPPGAIGFAVEAFGRTPILDERAFIRWIGEVARGPRLSTSDAVLIGSLVVQQGWTDAARTVFREAERDRSDFWVAVGQFVHLLRLVERALFAWKSGSHTISEDEWWAMLEEVAVDLLPNAWALEGVWESAGGKVGDLRSMGTGKERVHHALQQVRAGNRVTPLRLIEILRRDFEFNNRLDIISNMGRQVGVLPRVR